jgi:hypothetical protein
MINNPVLNENDENDENDMKRKWCYNTTTSYDFSR